MLNLVLPKIETESLSRNYGHFVISPLERGYGITLGNSLRRVLLSSLEGAAVTSVRISGIHHEFTAIPHVREDTTRLILNLKQIRMRSHSEDPIRIHVEVTSEGPITAGDLVCPPEIEIINPDLYLLTADSNDVDLDLELVVERGRGYSPAEERRRLPLGEIPVDAIFSPVRKAAYKVEHTRIGQQTDYDKLNLEIWTDGTIAPEDSLHKAASILVEHLSLLSGTEARAVEKVEEEEEGIPSRVAEAPIEELELTVRAYNCLKRAGITKVGEILKRMEKGEEEMLAIRNFGAKSLDELVEKLDEKGYLHVPGVDLSAFLDRAAVGGDDEDEG
ncbi:MAG: DNA-directed RNA polymerase subunit alpha [Caldilineaceae bacterium]|nr:DNA-directed RNA polymerase subunit alpha [Caldilineaceae bacterium]MBP8109052.1 DNA-directed RNA polymerase subunit alpha [Caldilineaceae bacterium]MBP8122035.1 DNA-directed RNA polymerase subunit alpha [Caldilineaceae bacterium]